MESQGELQSGDLGEPKFYVNGTVFKGAWNRPQQDGPALRATALNIYAKYLLAYLEGTKLARVLRADVDFDVWPIIAKDLDHTVRYWNQTSFDLWEETSGSSFFTLSVSHRALVEGMALAKTLGRHCDGCYAAASQMLCFMESFWDVNHIRANLNARDQRSGIDASSILSSIHTYDPLAGCTNGTFQPCSSRALANHKTVTDSFRPLYGINSGIAQGQGVAIGRYAEDINHGGNPWYVTTLAAAEQLYLAGLQWQYQSRLTIDETSLPFFRDLLPTISIGTYSSHSDSATFRSVLSAVRKYADSYMALVQKYMPADGGLPEQFDKNNGVAVSASNFTWSHAAFYTAANRRVGIEGSSWGEPLNNALNLSQCYCHARVTFTVRSDPHRTLFVVGDVPELGDGKNEHARVLKQDLRGFLISGSYGYANYSAQIEVPALTRINYHYFMLAKDHPKEEEEYQYRHIDTGECGSNVDTVRNVFFPDG